MKNLKCIKNYAGDMDQYGVDFVAGHSYTVKSTEGECSYIETENGSDILMGKDEMNEVFETLKCTACGNECFDDKGTDTVQYPTVCFNGNGKLICEECSIDYEDGEGKGVRFRDDLVEDGYVEQFAK